MNPFTAPHGEPLCPWKHGHDDYYSFVDNYLSARSAFIDALTDPEVLRDEGRIVAVCGPSGCGKTAMMHHCVHWLAGTASTDLELTIVDLTRLRFPTMPVPPGRNGPPDTVSALDRMPTVCQEVLKKCTKELRPEQYSELEMITANPAQFYFRLVQAVAPVVPVILLPPSDDVGDRDLFLYSEILQAGMAVFMETSTPYETMVRQAGTGRSVILRLGYLNESDAWTFYQDRIAQFTHRVASDMHHGGGIPTIPETEVKRVTAGRTTTIGALQRILQGLYERVRTRPVPGGVITSEYMIEYLLDLTLDVNTPGMAS